jgi:hypothetical protein
MANNKLIPILVTTEFKGVFFGYAPPGEEGPERLRIENARLVVYWSNDVRGLFGLASSGPTPACRIGPRVPAVTLFKITSVAEVSDEAAAKFEESPWAK